MKNIESLLTYLGEPYTQKTIDFEETVYRLLHNDYELEVSNCSKKDGPFTVYVWKNKNEIIGTYSGIRGRETLKDFLGYCSVKYQNLTAEFQVEREP